MVKYWFKMINTENVILRNVFDSIHNLCLEGKQTDF